MGAPANSMMTKAPLVGFKTCLPPIRSTNLLAMAMTAVTTATPTRLVRSSRHNDNDEISALFTS